MRAVPPEVIASWPKPNYVNPEDRAGSIIIAAAICVPIIVIVFLCRMYSRLFISKFFGWDDWLIIPAVISGIGYSCATLVGIQFGWYKHIWDVDPSSIPDIRKVVVASNFCGLFNVAFTKLSILCLYLHIAPPSHFQTAVYVLLAITTAWFISLTVTTCLLCIPLHAYWEIGFLGESTCLAEMPHYVSFTSVDLFLDVVIYILPLPVLIPLRMPKRQKIVLIGIFGLGILVIASSAVRLPSLIRVTRSFDLSWELYDAALWTEIECTVGIFCASAPALKPLVQKIIPSAFGSSISSRGARSTDDGIGKGNRHRGAGSYSERRMAEDYRGGWKGWDQGTTVTTAKHGSEDGLVHELGVISGTEHIEDGRGGGMR